ncbi:MAG: hypothetical protein OXD31_06255, partial [Chloroflexi bacterium]|nr:hypothetical protein [Chloroflexota bacterium]
MIKHEIKDRTSELERILEQRIMVMDGAWGVLLQGMQFTEDEYRGKRFAEHSHELRGCIDVLSLTRPDVIR